MSKRKLLLADDSMTIQKVVNLTFADEGIEVFTVGNGSLAIEKLSEIEPDLVLADVHMPGLTGYEVCEQIRMNPRFQHIPVMLLVGSFEPFDEREAERVGASDYLTKPFQSIRQLIQKVTTLLDNQPETNESDTLVVAIDNQDVQLSSPIDQSQNFQTEQSAAESAQTFATAQNVFDSPSQEFSFGDNAIDDEMIETNSGNNFANSGSSNQLEVQDFGQIQTSNEMASPSLENLRAVELATEKSVADELTISEMRSTEPLSYNDIQEMNSSMLTPTAQSQNQPQNQNDWEIFEFETKVVSEPASSIEPAQIFSSENLAQNAFEAKSIDDFALEFDSPISYSEPEEQLLETSDLEFIGEEKTIQTEVPVEEQSVNFDFSIEPKTSTANDNEPLELDLDEMNLLQIDDEDSILDLQTDEVGVNNSAVNSEIQAGQNEMANAVFAESQSINNAPTQFVNQAVSDMNPDFPPHVIEAIARLVVEKLSDKVIERIAWEIVPDRFDLIVRQQMENRNR